MAASAPKTPHDAAGGDAAPMPAADTAAAEHTPEKPGRRRGRRAGLTPYKETKRSRAGECDLHAKSKMRNGLLILFSSCLSPDNNQNAHWVHKHLDVVFAKLSAKFGFEATHVHSLSDNCGEQYKGRTALGRMCLSSVPMTLNFFQARHGKSFVGCLSSVWRSAVDARNGQNRKQQLLNPHDIV